MASTFHGISYDHPLTNMQKYDGSSQFDVPMQSDFPFLMSPAEFPPFSTSHQTFTVPVDQLPAPTPKMYGKGLCENSYLPNPSAEYGLHTSPHLADPSLLQTPTIDPSPLKDQRTAFDRSPPFQSNPISPQMPQATFPHFPQQDQTSDFFLNPSFSRSNPPYSPYQALDIHPISSQSPSKKRVLPSSSIHFPPEGPSKSVRPVSSTTILDPLTKRKVIVYRPCINHFLPSKRCVEHVWFVASGRYGEKVEDEREYRFMSFGQAPSKPHDSPQKNKIAKVQDIVSFTPTGDMIKSKPKPSTSSRLSFIPTPPSRKLEESQTQVTSSTLSTSGSDVPDPVLIEKSGLNESGAESDLTSDREFVFLGCVSPKGMIVAPLVCSLSLPHSKVTDCVWVSAREFLVSIDGTIHRVCVSGDVFGNDLEEDKLIAQEKMEIEKKKTADLKLYLDGIHSKAFSKEPQSPSKSELSSSSSSCIEPTSGPIFTAHIDNCPIYLRVRSSVKVHDDDIRHIVPAPSDIPLPMSSPIRILSGSHDSCVAISVLSVKGGVRVLCVDVGGVVGSVSWYKRVAMDEPKVYMRKPSCFSSHTVSVSLDSGSIILLTLPPRPVFNGFDAKWKSKPIKIVQKIINASKSLKMHSIEVVGVIFSHIWLTSTILFCGIANQMPDLHQLVTLVPCEEKKKRTIGKAGLTASVETRATVNPAFSPKSPCVFDIKILKSPSSESPIPPLTDLPKPPSPPALLDIGPAIELDKDSIPSDNDRVMFGAIPSVRAPSSDLLQPSFPHVPVSGTTSDPSSMSILSSLTHEKWTPPFLLVGSSNGWELYKWLSDEGTIFLRCNENESRDSISSFKKKNSSSVFMESLFQDKGEKEEEEEEEKESESVPNFMQETVCECDGMKVGKKIIVISFTEDATFEVFLFDIEK
ncbi:hypothetical protein ADUPG1_010755 [Aduncisulcus paluster]|uniref:Uncharacterized protein n=1 Tax=Aduncisulcus paluster TaxID=2918883 RepID=A0ABQ5JVH2_9EUKA|nr:hypothetical protein ADUPG1_010755 [Aduncisulcus paluster]